MDPYWEAAALPEMGKRVAERWSTPLGRHLRGLVFDYPSALPSLSEVMESLREELEKAPSVGVLFVRLDHWGRMDDMFPWEEAAGAYESLAAVAAEMVGKDLRAMDIPTDLGLQGEGLVVLLSAPRNAESVAIGAVDVVADRVALGIREHLDSSLPSALAGRLSVEVGSGIIACPSEEDTFEDALVRGLVDAEKSAHVKGDAWLEENAVNLEKVLTSGKLNALYQPVVDLAVSDVAGFSAVPTAGPLFLNLQQGDVFLDIARRVGWSYRAYDLYHRRALEGALESLDPDEFLMLQVAGTELVEAAVRVMSILYGSGTGRIGPNNILFMVEARPGLDALAGNMVAFRSAADMGFRLGVDVSPTSTIPLDTLAALDPDYLRLGGRTVKDIHERRDEFELVLMLSRFASRHGMRLMTGDCRASEELEVLQRAGVELVQGEYVGSYTARPVRDGVRLA